jgi:CheY-like chemotaxis protein
MRRDLPRSELPRILLVEDDPNDAELALAVLTESRLAYDVVHVGDGQAALDCLREWGALEGRRGSHPAVVLLDLELPKVDGFEVLVAIKADPRLRSIPVVVLTSSREQQDLVRSYDLGVNAFVVKPVEFAELSAAIRELGLFWAVLNETPRPVTGPE